MRAPLSTFDKGLAHALKRVAVTFHRIQLTSHADPRVIGSAATAINGLNLPLPGSAWPLQPGIEDTTGCTL